ncbi:glyceraldehyde-3-phosphate dehydrogenase 1 [Scheffersomyces spartinae]|uniref:Glyceraldehyde-3-phosphate dehydrogenase 1 n=1 Tax=Scheffersomyces spartinae TaxID=45513 RepID=A0A9P7V8H7_9ASCO|nr:glyceraldehyde-3-phosphate dehydrogenase 1 [Scheffersomyces spartinae]KAG7193128.1 glyceraldehyde-3-phosphate dehydrogenase 1 [Scheffersomyces spartinae]
MPEKELSYMRSNEASNSADKSGGVYVNDFESPSETKLTGWAKFADSFKRFDDNELGLDPNLTEAQKIAVRTANSPLSRSLKNRHLQMIAIGGSIGTGLFVGSGTSLRTGGPAGVLIAYILIGSMIYCTVQALGELAITFPVSGAFVTYNTRFIDESFGFAMAWNYALQWLVVMPLELVAASIVINYWNKTINHAAFVVIFWVFIAAINFFGVRGYGEAEFFFSIIKVIAVVGFIFLGIILCAGGGPKGGYIGGKHWQNPGAFAAGFKGVCTVFVSAAFAFSGTELCGLAAAEASNPRKSLPKAIKQVFWRITLFYVISLTLVGLLVPYNDPQLIGSTSWDAAASPFVIAIKNGGISGLPSVMNVVILISVLSVGNSSVFGSSRTLAALAAAGQAPKIFGYIDKRGRPLAGIVLQLIFGLLCFTVASPHYGDVFTWLLALSGLSALFTWAAICLCHIRFRRALSAQGRSTDEIAFTAQAGVWGSWYGFILNTVVIIAQFWIAVWPLGAAPNAEVFFENYLSFPVILAFYLGHKIWKKNWKLFIRAKDIDIDTGRRELDLDLLRQELVEERAYIASLPFYKRCYKFWC